MRNFHMGKKQPKHNACQGNFFENVAVVRTVQKYRKRQMQ